MRYFIVHYSITRNPSCRWQIRATLEIRVTGHSRASKVTPFDSLRVVFYYRRIVTLCLKCTVFEIWRHIGRKSPKKPTPLSFGTFLGGDPLRIFRRVIPCQKVNSSGYQMVYISRACFRSARHNTGVWRTTDGHVAVANTYRAMHSVARVNVIFRPCGRTISCACAIFRPCDVASHVIESRDTRPQYSNRLSFDLDLRPYRRKIA